jgi:hypothetical protein
MDRATCHSVWRSRTLSVEPIKGDRPPRSAQKRAETRLYNGLHGLAAREECFLGHVDTLPWLVCICGIASDSVEAFGMRDDVTKANQRHTVVQDPSVHLDAAELRNHRPLGYAIM